MRPVKFPGVNVVFAEDQPEYLPLPARKSGQGIVTSCWSFGFWERLRVLFCGRVYVTLLTFGHPLQPQILGVKNPRSWAG